MADMMGSAAGPVASGTMPPDRPETEHSAGRIVDDAKELGRDVLAAIRDAAGVRLLEQRHRAADEIAAIGDVLQQSAGPLREQAGPTVARYADEAARRLGSVAASVRSRSWSALAADMEDFARRRPIPFLAATIAGGFLGGRLLLAARPATGPGRLRAAAPPERTWSDATGIDGGTRAAAEERRR